MVNFSIKKSGFSLVEALIVMLILSIFLAASSKVITQKKEEPPIVNQHGQFECWVDSSNKHSSKYTVEGVPYETVKGNSCTFKPTINAAVYHFYVIYPSNHGYYMTTISNIASSIDINLTSNGVNLKNENNETLSYSYSTEKTGERSNIESYLKYVCKDSSLISNINSRSVVLIVW